jgi:hypothetical protein
MRITRSALLIVPLLLLACDREPVAPETPTPSFSATHGELVFYGTDDVALFVSCANDGLGEMVYFYGPWRIPVSAVTSNSGNFLLRWQDYELLDGYQITGLTSGDDWTRVDYRANAWHHFFANGNFSRSAIFLEHFENQDGDKMFTNTVVHFTLANGEFRIERREVPVCKPY